MKKRMFIVNHGTYPFNVLVCIGNKHKEIVKFIEKRKYKLSEEEKEKLWMTGEGRTVILLGGQTIIRIDIKKDFYPTLTHEVFHAVEFLFDKIGIKHSDSSSEAWAYQIEYLMGSILEKLKRK